METKKPSFRQYLVDVTLILVFFCAVIIFWPSWRQFQRDVSEGQQKRHKKTRPHSLTEDGTGLPLSDLLPEAGRNR